MAIPFAQVSPYARKVGGKRKRRPKHKVRRQTGNAKPPSTGPPGQPPPKVTFGHPKPPPPPPSKRALDWAGLRQKGVHYHANYLRRLWEANKFPKPFKISPHRLAWWEHEVDAWFEEKAGATEQKISSDEPPAGTTEVTLKLSAEQLAAVRALLGGQVIADGALEPRGNKRGKR